MTGEMWRGCWASDLTPLEKHHWGDRGSEDGYPRVPELGGSSFPALPEPGRPVGTKSIAPVEAEARVSREATTF
eukprot:9612769-Heterocapsa_arctica.AAC.1